MYKDILSSFPIAIRVLHPFRINILWQDRELLHSDFRALILCHSFICCLQPTVVAGAHKNSSRNRSAEVQSQCLDKPIAWLEIIKVLFEVSYLFLKRRAMLSTRSSVLPPFRLGTRESR